MRSYFRFLLPVAVLLGAISCQEKPNGPEEPEDTAICLSSEATANCYIITAAGEYYFDATVMGNGASTDGIYPRSLATESAELVWQTSAGMISGVRAEEGKIHFTASNTPGNALIAACNTSGDIIWSWHIWHPAGTPCSVTAKSGYEIMNMNLGALNSTLPADYDEASAGSQIYGMLYQWGRKDPFPAAASLTGDTSTTGAPLYDADGSASFFPAAARYDGSYAMLYGSVSGYWGNYWSNCPGSQTTGVQGMGSSCLAFMVSESYDMLSPNASGSRADAYSVRCVKE